MDTSDNVGDPLSLRQCFCNADLCGGETACWRLFDAPTFAALSQKAKETGIPIQDQILWVR